MNLGREVRPLSRPYLADQLELDHNLIDKGRLCRYYGSSQLTRPFQVSA